MKQMKQRNNINYTFIDIDTMKHNPFANMLYEKPNGKIKRVVYYIKKAKPMYKKLKYETASFKTMCAFSDFIKILEMVFFYYNDTKKPLTELKDDGIRIISDNNIDDKFKKNITIIDDINKSIIIFNMESRMLKNNNINYALAHVDDQFEECINIKCYNTFGKKMTTNFTIINGKVLEELDINTHNLLYNINHLLNKSMADLFIKYYKMI